MKDIIKNLKKSAKWKFQLSITIKFISSTSTDEERVMHYKSDNIEIIIHDDEFIKQHFKSLLYRYQTGSEMKDRDFIAFICFITIVIRQISIVMDQI